MNKHDERICGASFHCTEIVRNIVRYCEAAESTSLRIQMFLQMEWMC